MPDTLFHCRKEPVWEELKKLPGYGKPTWATFSGATLPSKAEDLETMRLSYEPITKVMLEPKFWRTILLQPGLFVKAKSSSQVWFCPGCSPCSTASLALPAFSRKLGKHTIWDVVDIEDISKLQWISVLDCNDWQAGWPLPIRSTRLDQSLARRKLC